MRTGVATILLLSSLLAGCCSTIQAVCDYVCPREETPRIAVFRDSPEMSFETFRTALLVGAPDIVYESLSPGFKEKHGVPGLRTFTAGYAQYREDFDELGRLLARAAIGPLRYGEIDGRYVAWLTLKFADAEGTFKLVDIPSCETVVALEGYPPDRVVKYLPGRDFSSVLRVRDGLIEVGPLDAADAGVTEPGEVVRLALQHNWLLEDVQELTNVKPLLERFRAVEQAEEANRTREANP
jgi:hypothetical protein